MTLSPAAKAHRDAEATLYRDEVFKLNPDGFHTAPFCNKEALSDAFENGFDEGYEFARKEIWEIVKRDWQPRNKPMFATPEEYFATFNQPPPEGE